MSTNPVVVTNVLRAHSIQGEKRLSLDDDSNHTLANGWRDRSVRDHAKGDVGRKEVEKLLSKSLSCSQRQSLYWSLIRKVPWYHRLFIALVAMQVTLFMIDSALTVADTFPDHPSETVTREAGWIVLLVSVSALFCGYFGIHATLTSNAFELIAYFIAALALIIRRLATWTQCSLDTSVCYGMTASAVIITSSSIVLLFWMYPDLLWRKYKAVGAEVETRSMYRLYEIYSSVAKVDLQFSTMTLITGLVFFTFDDRIANNATALNVVLFVIEIVWEWVGSRAVHKESAMAMYLFWTLSIFFPMFVINVGVERDVLFQYASMTDTIIIYCTALVALVNRLITVALSVALFRNFGDKYHGLRRVLEGGDAIQRFEKAKVITRAEELPTVVSKSEIVAPNPMVSQAVIRQESSVYGQETVLGVGLLTKDSFRPSMGGDRSRTKSMKEVRPSNTDEYMTAIDDYLDGRLDEDVEDSGEYDPDDAGGHYETQSRLDRVTRMGSAAAI